MHANKIWVNYALKNVGQNMFIIWNLYKGLQYLKSKKYFCGEINLDQHTFAPFII